MIFERGDYLIVVQAPAFALPNGKFATESAFAKHLVELRASTSSRFARVTLLAPEMSEDVYARSKFHLAELEEERDGVRFVPAFPLAVSRVKFWLSSFLPLLRSVWLNVGNSGLVHSGLSDDLWRPMMAIVNAVAWVRQKPTIFVVDIDFRKDSTRYRRLGKWGIKSYIVNRYAYDPLKWIQVWFAVRAFDLVLLKSQSMVADFGRGRSNVRNFFDTVHGEFDVLSDAGLQQKLQTSRTRRPLRAAYFGRLVEYKGVALSVQAIDLARRRGADVELRIIGSGECREELKQLVRQLALAHVVEFVDPVPYGSELFDKLADVDVTIATPLVEDTPRGAFDSMARGIPIVAFDINYYSDLAHARAGVTTAKWPNVEAVASVLVDLAAERGRVESLAQEAVSFARKNTQDFWIRERSEWVNRALEARAKRSP